MIEFKTTVETAGENSGRLAELTVDLTGIDYEKCIECLYPFILRVMQKKASRFPEIMGRLNEHQDMTCNALVSFMSSFPDSVKEELIKAAFDDVLAGEGLSWVNGILAGKNIPAKLSTVSLTVSREKK